MLLVGWLDPWKAGPPSDPTFFSSGKEKKKGDIGSIQYNNRNL